MLNESIRLSGNIIILGLIGEKSHHINQKLIYSYFYRFQIWEKDQVL